MGLFIYRSKLRPYFMVKFTIFVSYEEYDG